jgi:hypothetical protein
MTSWLERNTKPIGLVLFAALVVIIGFEVIDALTQATPVDPEADAGEPEDLASIAGLIKVMLFLGVGALLSIPVRRRARRDAESSAAR